ncbi:DUF4870 domain-containing protein [Georgenia subflava]|uniref:DUF4870 domain-containing protein n=1 Tax=Georgenia subflava TaxID=1622177 RepID=A0A6N7EMC8_9MICO|nr:DUF4870 domain-containing protein [Georgenia subflava]MPV38591.1 DUF4870 domain-containing protein [Georgenia subflava]
MTTNPDEPAPSPGTSPDQAGGAGPATPGPAQPGYTQTGAGTPGSSAHPPPAAPYGSSYGPPPGQAGQNAPWDHDPHGQAGPAPQWGQPGQAGPAPQWGQQCQAGPGPQWGQQGQGGQDAPWGQPPHGGPGAQYGPPPAGGPGYQGGYQYRPPVMNEADQRLWATLAHLSGLIFPLFGPLVIWLVLKERGAFVDDQGKEATNFHITLVILGFVFTVVTVLTLGLGSILYLFYIAAVVFAILAAIAANRGERYRYPLTIRLIR